MSLPIASSQVFSSLALSLSLAISSGLVRLHRVDGIVRLPDLGEKAKACSFAAKNSSRGMHFVIEVSIMRVAAVALLAAAASVSREKKCWKMPRCLV